jgi:pSer/pThr/pTyr-binding forkhead associated (FHA) protein
MVKAKLCDTQSIDSEILLEQLPVVLGRGPEAGIRLQDRWASKLHCEISERSGMLFVRDLGSRHGCLINGRHAAEAPLTPGDKLTVGLTTFIVSHEIWEKEPN